MKASFVDTLPAEMFGGTDFWLFSNKWDLLHRKAQSYKVSNKNDLFCTWRDFNKTSCGISKYHI